MRQLVVLLLRGAARKRIKQLATLRGIAYFALSLLVLAMLLLPQEGFIEAALASGGLPEPGALQQRAAVWLPLSLLLMCLYTALTASGPAFYLSAPERNFLLTAPLARQDILLYKFCMFALGAAFSAVLLSFLTTSSGLPLAIAVGTFVTFTFAQLFSVCINMLVSHPGVRVSAYIRWPVAVVVAVLLLSLGSAAFNDNISDNNISFTEMITHSPLVNGLTLPFKPFSNVLTATASSQVAVWGALAMAINLGLLWLIIRLDASNPIAFDVPASPPATDHTKSLGLLKRGVDRLLVHNPMAGQQAITALRGSGKRLAMLFLLMLPLGPVLLAPNDSLALWTRLGLLFVLTAYVLPRSLVFDFRCDMAKVSFYKTLPLASWKVCAGQLIVPILISTALVWLLMLSALPWLPEGQGVVIAQLAPFVPIANGLLFAADNLLFLLFPKGHIPTGRVDFDFMGRAVIELVTKTSLLSFASSAALWAGITTVQWLDLGRSGLVLVSWVTMMAVFILLLPLLGAALRRFEPS